MNPVTELDAKTIESAMCAAATSDAVALDATTGAPDDTSDQVPPGAGDGAASVMERVNTALVLAGSLRHLARLTVARHTASTTVPLLVAAVPAVRGLAAARLLLGRPARVERAVLNGLVAGLGAALTDLPGLDR